MPSNKPKSKPSKSVRAKAREKVKNMGVLGHKETIKKALNSDKNQKKPVKKKGKK